MKNSNSFNWAVFFEGACYGLMTILVLAIAVILLVIK